MTKGIKKFSWVVTPWSISPKGRWEVQPWIIVDGRLPFKANHPKDYIAELEKMSVDKELEPGIFYTLIGQFKDAMILKWRD